MIFSSEKDLCPAKGADKKAISLFQRYGGAALGAAMFNRP
jgi:hypothetical protein